MQQLLNKLEKIILKYDEIEKIKGTRFNIFSILNMERKEFETHSNFICELLYPDGLHNKDDLFLKLFFSTVLGIKSDENFKNAIVIQEDTTDANRRIDITIETEKYLIGVEMKIDARDQNTQMFDYYEELKNRKSNKEVILCYLTLDGKEPTKKSIEKKDKVLSEDDYLLVSFETEIINWIELCIKECATDTILREALVQYLNLVKKLTNKSYEKGKIMEMVELFKNADNLKIYLEAQKASIETQKEMQRLFWNNLKEKLDKTSYKFIYETNNKEKTLEDAINRYYDNLKEHRSYGFTYYLTEDDIYCSIWLENGVFLEIGSLKSNYKDTKDFSKIIMFSDLLEYSLAFDILNPKELNKITYTIIEETLKEIEEFKQTHNIS